MNVYYYIIDIYLKLWGCLRKLKECVWTERKIIDIVYYEVRGYIFYVIIFVWVLVGVWFILNL